MAVTEFPAPTEHSETFKLNALIVDSEPVNENTSFKFSSHI